MPNIDASIPLGVKTPDPMQGLSSLLNVANSAQTLKQNQQATQQGAMDLQERQAMQQVLADPANYTAPDGSFDPQKAQANIMKAAPTTGTKYWSALATAHQQSIQAQRFLNSQTTENRQQIGQALYSAMDAGPDVVEKTLDTIGSQYKGAGPVVDNAKGHYRQVLNSQGPDAAKQFLAQTAAAVMPQETQQGMATPGGVAFNTGTQSGVISTKPGTAVPAGQPFAVTQNQVGPAGQESTTTDAQGNPFVVTRAPNGAIVGTRPLQSSNPATPGPFTLPPNETAETMKDLQGQRGAAQQAAVAAPVLHDINRTIVQEASKGLNTGALGALTQRVASATGYNLAGESATDYNLLGKMLERSALTSAQSMGPHTNAGLEAAVRANGSLEYTPQAIKKIAYLNDAIVSGSELYQKGLENAINSSQNGVFAKRQFDSEWGKVATPQALRLKNAVDNGNKEEIAAINSEVGGKGTPQEIQQRKLKLHQQLTRMLQLAGQ